MLSYNWPKIYALNKCTYRTSFNHGPNTNALYMLYIFQPTMWRLCKKKYLYRQSSQIFWNHLKKKQKLRNILDLHIHIYICINQTTLKTVRAMLIWVPSKFVYHMKEELRKNSKAEQSIFTDRYENLFLIETCQHIHKTHLHTYIPARFYRQMQEEEMKKRKVNMIW